MNKEVDKLISNAPLISVITVVYNSVSTIEETIMSVINQTYSNIEYIVIDGGSTDGTVDIIKKYHEHISYWVSEPDKGIYDAMNKGIKVSTGEWGHFLNSGDVYASVDSLMQIIDHCSTIKNADVIYGNLICKYDFGRLLLKPAPLEHFEHYFPISHPATLVRLKILKNTLFDINLRIVADFKQLRQLYYGNYKFVYFPMALVQFDAITGISSTKHALHYLEIKEVLCEEKRLWTKINFAMLLMKEKIGIKLSYFIPTRIKKVYLKNRLLSNERFKSISL